MDSPHNNFHVKQVRDQDSSSTLLSGQSHHEVGDKGGNSDGQNNSAHSGYSEAYERQVEFKKETSQGTLSFSFPPSQSMVGVPSPCDPFYGHYLPALGPQNSMHPQFGFITPARVPLPPDFGEYEPIYVNSKQYQGILRRRRSRAKLEAQRKLAKDRKPYLHESRHLHALKRARGCGGRFLKKQQPERTSTTSSESESEVSKSETSNVCTSTTSSSDFSSISHKDDMTLPSYPWFSGYVPHLTVQDGGGSMVFNGSQLRVSAFH